MYNVVLRILVVAFLCIGCVGCGNGLMKIGGKVTYNGTPVQDGEIRFLPATGKGPSAAAMIIDGKYSVETTPGEKKVKIFGNKVVGQRNIGVVVDIKEQFLPAKFNDQTELTCEITSGNSVQDFELTEP